MSAAVEDQTTAAARECVECTQEPDECDWCNGGDDAAVGPAVEVRPQAGAAASGADGAGGQATSPAEPVNPGVARMFRMMGIPLPRDGDDDKGVNCIGYLGFFLVNVAAWLMIGYTSALNWETGFVLCLLYTIGLAAGANFLQRYGNQYLSFQSILWVLACWFIYVLGLYISVKVVGPLFSEIQEIPFPGSPTNCQTNTGPVYSNPDNDLTAQLSGTPSPELLAWASGDVAVTASYGLFQGHTLFMAKGPTTTGTQLLISDGTQANAVYPKITGAEDFAAFGGDVFFIGNENSDKHVFFMTPSDLSSGKWNATSLSNIDAITERYGGFSNLLVDGGNLYWKSWWSCPYYYGYVRSVFKYDGTTVSNLRGETCPEPVINEPVDPDCDSWIEGNPISNNNKPYAQLWSTLICANGSMLVVAAYILVSKKLPGVAFNLYVGTFLAVVLLFIIFVDDPSSLFTFIRRFNTAYSSLTYAAMTVASLLIVPLPTLYEGMKDWVLPLVAIPFFFDIHYNLEIPFTDNFFAWVAYAALAAVQVVISIAINRRTPQTLGAICMFIIAWKISMEITVVLYGSTMEGEFSFLTWVFILLLEGVAIIVGSIAYTSRKDEIDAMVRESLRAPLRLLCCMGPASRKPTAGGNEENAEVVAETA